MLLTLSWALAAPCATPYSIDALADDLGAVEGAIREGATDAGTLAAQLEADVTCLDGLLPRVIAGRVYRAMAAGQLTTDPDSSAGDWLATAAEIDPSFRYTLADLPSEEHPAWLGWIRAVEAAEATEMATVDDHIWASGSFYLDGRRSNWPAAEPGLPHLLQRLQGDRVSTWRVLGNTFPSDLMSADDQSAPPPVDGQRIEQPRGRTKVEVTQLKTNNWPTERVALVAGGATVLAAGGALYGLAWNQRSQFDASNTRADTERLARRTNTLTVASTASLAAGAGTLGFGVLFFIVDGDPRPSLDLRF